MVTVHGRTRQQFYEGEADWDFVAQVKERGQHPGHRQWRYHHRGRRPPRRCAAPAPMA